MREQGYAAARAVAPSVYSHFLHYLERARAAGEDHLASLPRPDMIADLIGTAFWASLRREEGHPPKISIAFAAPGETGHPLIFADRLPFEPGVLTKLALAVERPGIHIGVVQDGAELSIWGTTRNLPRYCCVIEVAEPGLIVVKQHRREKLAKFVNVAVLEGDRIKIIDEDASSLPDCPELLSSLLGFDSPASWGGAVNVLVQLAVSMRAHGKGGLLLVVPSVETAWRDSIVPPMKYAVSPTYTELAQLSQEPGDETHIAVWREDLARAVDAVGGLTAVDGATVLTATYEVLAFGAKVARRRGSSPVDLITVTEPIEGGIAEVVNPVELGGTRHLAGAQFVFDQRDAIALVASQDGRFTVFAWSPCEGMVHAHRVETLLL
jgi:sensor domain DACNV-containing protein